MVDEAQAWVDKAEEDLLAAQRLAGESVLAGVVAFHSQQAVEKALKSVVIVQQKRLIRTHDLKRLLAETRGFTFQPEDEATVDDELTALYTASRYPGDFGLLPTGQPTASDLRRKSYRRLARCEDSLSKVKRCTQVLAYASKIMFKSVSERKNILLDIFYLFPLSVVPSPRLSRL